MLTIFECMVCQFLDLFVEDLGFSIKGIMIKRFVVILMEISFSWELDCCLINHQEARTRLVIITFQLDFRVDYSI